MFENCLKSPRKKKFFSTLFSVFFGFRSFLMDFLPPLPKVECPIFLEIRNPWGKVFERNGLRYQHFYLKIVENRRAKKVLFSHFFTFEVPFNGLFPPLPKVGCPIFLEIRNPWGKVMERNGLKSPREKKVFFLLILPWSTLLWHRCYYPHRSRDALSPVCGIFSSISYFLYFLLFWVFYFSQFTFPIYYFISFHLLLISYFFRFNTFSKFQIFLTS